MLHSALNAYPFVRSRKLLYSAFVNELYVMLDLVVSNNPFCDKDTNLYNSLYENRMGPNIFHVFFLCGERYETKHEVFFFSAKSIF